MNWAIQWAISQTVPPPVYHACLCSTPSCPRANKTLTKKWRSQLSFFLPSLKSFPIRYFITTLQPFPSLNRPSPSDWSRESQVLLPLLFFPLPRTRGRSSLSSRVHKTVCTYGGVSVAHHKEVQTVVFEPGAQFFPCHDGGKPHLACGGSRFQGAVAWKGIAANGATKGIAEALWDFLLDLWQVWGTNGSVDGWTWWTETHPRSLHGGVYASVEYGSACKRGGGNLLMLAFFICFFFFFLGCVFLVGWFVLSTLWQGCLGVGSVVD